MTQWAVVALAAAAAACGRSGAVTTPAAAAPAAADLGVTPCTVVFAGDASATLGCRLTLCRTSGGADELRLLALENDPHELHALFGTGGALAVGSYGAAALSTVDAGVFLGNAQYATAGQDPRARLTLTAVQSPPADGACGGDAHGSAHATLLRQSTSAGQVTLDASF